MFEILFAIFMALVCPHHTQCSTSNGNSGQVTTLDDTGGETGHVPPKPPKGN